MAMWDEAINTVTAGENPLPLSVQQEIFPEYGQNVGLASDGFIVLAESRKEVPDILLSDLSMPGMSEYALFPLFTALSVTDLTEDLKKIGREQSVNEDNGSLFRRWVVGALSAASKLDRIAMAMLRIALVIVLVWIGGLKFVDYEADSIVPLVANSPAMSFLYHRPAEYRTHMNKEGELNLQHRDWHRENGTYTFSHWLGAVIISIGLLIAVYPIWPEMSALGSGLLILMACTTLSFLITTPEAWVPALGDANHGFPYLSGAGRLIVKDVIMLAAAVVTLSDSAKTALGLRAAGQR